MKRSSGYLQWSVMPGMIESARVMLVNSLGKAFSYVSIIGSLGCCTKSHIWPLYASTTALTELLT